MEKHYPFTCFLCVINHPLCAKFGSKTFTFLFHINFTWLDETKLILVDVSWLFGLDWGIKRLFEDRLNVKLYIVETVVSVIVFDDDSNFNNLFYQDQDLKKIFEAFPEMLFVDAVRKFNEYRMSLYSILVADEIWES